MPEATDTLPADLGWTHAHEARGAALSATLARPHFRTSAHGYDREEVDAFVLRTEGTQLQLQKRITDLENAILGYEQRTIDAEARYQAQFANHEREAAIVTSTRQHLEQWLSSSIPVLSQYQALLHEAGPAQQVVPQSTPNGVDVAAPTATNPPASQRPSSGPRRSIRLTYLLAPLLATTAIPAFWVLQDPIEPVRAEAAPTRVVERVAPAAMPVTTLTATPIDASAPPPTIASAAAQAPADLTIALKASGRSWLRVEIDNAQTIERTLQNGEELTVTVRKEAVIRLGNAGGVALTLNGRTGVPLGRRGEVVTTRITPANYGRFIQL